eukprot:comp19260_c1_seq1/m.22059 comp19260_c1_seq1/g.22059  ORF comp19260_c1_seq1/g.22059 comp19260_c1_seq1/m.22059 type:complete len:255 (-) comp19260_c1_seq1:223-987(-)
MESNPLLEFTLLAKQARGAGCAALVVQATERPGVYVFSELLNMPNVQELKSSHPHTYRLLEVFAWGTYSTYVGQQDMPTLSDKQALKLRQLTIVSLSSSSKVLAYDQLLRALGLANVRALEDVIIEGVYAGVFRATLDQAGQRLEIEWAIGRDLRPGQLQEMIQQLLRWSGTCETMLSVLDEHMARANTAKAGEVQRQAELDREVERVKSALKDRKGDDGGGRARSDFKSSEYHEETRRGGKRMAKDWDGRPKH